MHPRNFTRVRRAARLLPCRFPAPVVWLEPSEPCTVVQATLPDANGRVGFAEVEAPPAARGVGGELGRRALAARRGSSEYVRGSLASVPFMPGARAWLCA